MAEAASKMTACVPDIDDAMFASATERFNDPELRSVCMEMVNLHIVPTTLEARFDEATIAHIRLDVYEGCKLLIRTLATPVARAHTSMLLANDGDVITTRQRPYDIMMTTSHLLGERGKLIESTIIMMLGKYIEFFSRDSETKRIIADLDEKIRESARNAIILEVRAMKREIMEGLKTDIEKTAMNVEVGHPALADAIQSAISRLLKIKNKKIRIPSVTFLTAEDILVHCNTDAMQISLRERKSHESSQSVDPLISGHVRIPLPIKWDPQSEDSITIS